MNSGSKIDILAVILKDMLTWKPVPFFEPCVYMCVCVQIKNLDNYSTLSLNGPPIYGQCTVIVKLTFWFTHIIYFWARFFFI